MSEIVFCLYLHVKFILIYILLGLFVELLSEGYDREKEKVLDEVGTPQGSGQTRWELLDSSVGGGFC